MAPGLSVNLDDVSFAAWLSALEGNAKVACIGDSTTEGVGVAGSVDDAYPGLLVGKIAGAAATLNPVDGAVWGTTFYNTDARVSLGTGWSLWNSTGWGPATTTSRAFTATTSASGNLSITFPHSFDRIVLYYAKIVGSGTVGVDVDGGASLGSVNTSAASSQAGESTLTCAAGTHTINIHPPTGGTVFIMGVEAYLSTQVSVLVSNAGATSSTAANWVSAAEPWSKLRVFDLYQPDLTLVSLGINDSIANVSAASYETSLTTIATKGRLYGDVLLMSPIPSQDSALHTRQVAYRQKCADVATALGCGFLDIGGEFVDWTTANGNGYMADAYHPSAAGYDAWADLIVEWLPLPSAPTPEPEPQTSLSFAAASDSCAAFGAPMGFTRTSMFGW